MSDFSKLKVKKNSKEYILNVCTQDTEQNITGTKNFSKLTVNSKNVVTSINGISPSEDGNVTIVATPDYSASVSQSINTDYIAPSDGFIYGELSSAGNSTAYYILIDDTYVIGTQQRVDMYADTFVIFMVPIKKGTKYRCVVTAPEWDSKVNFAPLYKGE